MTPRKAKRRINTSDDFIIITQENEDIHVGYQNWDSWQILFNACVNSPDLLELIKQITDQADNAIQNNNGAHTESE